MNIFLHDVDSVIPNIALMKLSTFHKSKGDTVILFKRNQKIPLLDFDYGYTSCIFTKNKNIALQNPYEVGGTGVDIEKTLPNNIEHLMPDYSLYPENEYSIGFTTRGCIRNCEFCFVPKKEGMLRRNARISEFDSPRNKKIMLLDNNILAYNDYKSVFSEIRSTKKRTGFKQGMDFRLMTDDRCDELLSIKYDGDYTFAYDSIKDREVIERNISKYIGKFPEWRCKFFVLVGFNSTIADDIFRVMYLKQNKILAYVMRHENAYHSEYCDFHTDLSAWCNQVFCFKKLDFITFLQKRHTKKERIKRSTEIWNGNFDIFKTDKELWVNEGILNRG